MSVSNTPLKLNICKLGVTCLNIDDFKDVVNRTWHNGLGFDGLDDESFNLRVSEVIDDFKLNYNTDSVELSYLDESLYPFSR